MRTTNPVSIIQYEQDKSDNNTKHEKRQAIPLYRKLLSLECNEKYVMNFRRDELKAQQQHQQKIFKTEMFAFSSVSFSFTFKNDITEHTRLVEMAQCLVV